MKIPCRECLIYPICKSQVIEHVKGGGITYTAVISVLHQKCSLLRKFIGVDGVESTLEFRTTSPGKIFEVVHFFN